MEKQKSIQLQEYSHVPSLIQEKISYAKTSARTWLNSNSTFYSRIAGISGYPDYGHQNRDHSSAAAGYRCHHGNAVSSDSMYLRSSLCLDRLSTQSERRQKMKSKWYFTKSYKKYFAVNAKGGKLQRYINDYIYILFDKKIDE
jgi:hypothetical protein